jgi:Holliday junction resolvase
MEAKLQTTIIKFLKAEGAYVIKTKPQPGTPVGCPDIIFLFEGAWGAIEVKASKSSPWQPGQELTLKKLGNWSPFVYKAYPDNWLEIKADLLRRFF